MTGYIELHGISSKKWSLTWQKWYLISELIQHNNLLCDTLMLVKDLHSKFSFS